MIEQIFSSSRGTPSSGFANGPKRLAKENECRTGGLREVISPKPVNFTLHSSEDVRNFCAQVEGYTPRKPIAFISGSGPAGSTAALALLEQGFEVVMAEKRPSYTRTNIVELKEDVLKTVMALIPEADYESFFSQCGMAFKAFKYDDGDKKIGVTFDLIRGTHQNPIETPVSSKNYSFNDFSSAMLCDLEYGLNSYLVSKGVTFVHANTTIDLGERDTVEVTLGFDDDNISLSNLLPIDKVFIAEGANSPNRNRLVSSKEQAIDEYWVQRNFVVPEQIDSYIGSSFSVVNHADNGIQISKPSDKTISAYSTFSNTIFHDRVEDGKVQHVANVSVMTDENGELPLCKLDISDVVESICEQEVSKNFGFGELAGKIIPLALSNAKSQIVFFSITLKRATQFSIKNAILIGDSACSGSPIGGYGASIGMSSWVRIVKLFSKTTGKHSPTDDMRNQIEEEGLKACHIRLSRPNMIRARIGRELADLSIIPHASSS